MPLEPGGSAVVRLVLEAPVVARGGDRFVIRSYSPVVTIGGGWVIDPECPRRSPLPSEELASPDPAVRGRALIGRRVAGVEAQRLPFLLGVAPGVAAGLDFRNTTRLPSGWILPREELELVEAKVLQLVREYQRDHPSDAGMSRETLRRRLKVALRLTEAALERLAAGARVVFAEGVVRTPDFQPRVEGGDETLDLVVGLIGGFGLTPPRVDELVVQTGRKNIGAALRFAARTGALVAVEPDRYFAPKALEVFRTALAEIGGRGALITPAALRDRLRLSRKFLIPLLEWADAQHLTVRSGEGRRLARPLTD
jgi:selenocysteine-specific elongation factor